MKTSTLATPALIAAALMAAGCAGGDGEGDTADMEEVNPAMQEFTPAESGPMTFFITSAGPGDGATRCTTRYPRRPAAAHRTRAA